MRNKVFKFIKNWYNFCFVEFQNYFKKQNLQSIIHLFLYISLFKTMILFQQKLNPVLVKSETKCNLVIQNYKTELDDMATYWIFRFCSLKLAKKRIFQRILLQSEINYQTIKNKNSCFLKKVK